MKLGIHRGKSWFALSGLSLLLWVCSLMPAAAAQPIDPMTAQFETPLFSATSDAAFSYPAAGDPNSDISGRHLAQNKPRLYSFERAGIEPPQRRPAGPPKWQWFFNTGYRQDDLKWNTQGQTPDVVLTLPPRYSTLLSELTWSDLKILQLDFGLQGKVFRNLLVRAQLGYGTIFDGDNQDSDYWDDNRTVEWSRSISEADSGETWDVSLAVGYDFLLLGDYFKITPLGGLSLHVQNLTMQNGLQVVADYGWETVIPPGSQLAYLNSTYDTNWYGPWIGGEIGFLGSDKFFPGGPELVAGAEYHYVKYEGNGYWNLRGLSFDQKADGKGYVLYLGFKWFFNSRWALNFDARYQNWDTDSGTSKASDVFGNAWETVFNGTEWESIAASLGVTCRW